MAGKCPPGVICIENMTVTLVILSILTVFFLIYFINNNSNNRKNNDQNINYNIDIKRENTNSSNQSLFPNLSNLTGLFPRPSFSFSNISNDVLMNPYVPPVANEMAVMPINIRTQGFNSAYRQIGILTSSNNTQKILPLMGRPLISGRDMWQYYTMSELNNIKLPISRGKRSCTNEYGCDKLYDGDNVFVQGYNEVFNVTVYDNDVVRYLPVL